MLLTGSPPRARARWRSASANRPMACSGWRRSWLAAVKNCVLARFATSASWRAASAAAFSTRRRLRERLGTQLVLERALQGCGSRVVAASAVVNHDDRQHAGELVRCSRRRRGDAHHQRREADRHVGDEHARVVAQHRHHRDAEGIDGEDQAGLLDADRLRIEQPARQAPGRGRAEREHVPAQLPAPTPSPCRAL